MPYYSRLTGEKLAYRTPKEAHSARLARMRHLVWLGIGALDRMATEDDARLVMYTLTYRGVDDWQPRHIGGLCRWMRRQGSSGYVWVAELQKRGAVHYHALFLLPNGQPWRKPDAAEGGWAHGWTWVTDKIEKPWYIMKYLQKGSKDGSVPSFPKGLRLYGLSQSTVRRLSFEGQVAYRHSQIPAWFWRNTDDDCRDISSFRTLGGVLSGGLLAYSPYSKIDLPPVDTLNGTEYTKFLNLRNPVQE